MLCVSTLNITSKIKKTAITTMANTEIIDLILATVAEMFTYMLPVIGIMSGVIFITSFLFDVTLNAYKRVRG